MANKCLPSTAIGSSKLVDYFKCNIFDIGDTFFSKRLHLHQILRCIEIGLLGLNLSTMGSSLTRPRRIQRSLFFLQHVFKTTARARFALSEFAQVNESPYSNRNNCAGVSHGEGSNFEGMQNLFSFLIKPAKASALSHCAPV